VKAPASGNNAELSISHYFSEAAHLKAKLFFNRQAFRYYGYAGEEQDDPNKELFIPFWNDKQAFSRGGINLNLSGNPQTEFKYNAGLTYRHDGSKTGQDGNLVRIEGQFKKDFDLFQGNLDVSFTFSETDSVYNEAGQAFGERQQAVLKLNPSVLFGTDIASLRLGINTYSVTDADDDNDYLFSPDIKASWSPVKNWLTLFAGTDGYLQQNHYFAIAEENQFVSPYHDVKNTKYRYIFTGGIRGKVTPLWNYKFQADYSSIRNHHFYILRNRFGLNALGENELTTRPNTFDVVYDKVKQLNIDGEIRCTASDLINFMLKGTFYSYDTHTQAEAWHQPDFEASASVYLTPPGLFRFTANIYYLSERKALVAAELYNTETNTVQPTPDNETVWTLDPVLDMNFSVEYQYTRQLSFWTKVNNFSAQKYDRWLGYTGMSLNALLGLSYSF
jgi:hypothetical protein